MSGQQVISDFIQELISRADNRLEDLKRLNSESSELGNSSDDLAQAQVDLDIARSIGKLFANGQLTDKRLQEQLKQLRENNNG